MAGRNNIRFQYFLMLAALASIGVLGWSRKAELAVTWQQLDNLNLAILLLVPAIQILSYWTNARYYTSFLHVFGYHASLRRLFELSLALNFVNQAFPSAGLSGASFLGYSLKPGIPTGKTTLIQFGRYVLTYVSFVALLLVAGVMLYFGSNIAQITVRILVLLILLIVLASILLIFMLNRHERVAMVIKWLTALVDWLSRHVSGGRELIGKARIERLLKEFEQGYELIKKERRELKRPFWYALLGNILETATLYVVFIAFGAYVNPGGVIIAYAIANLAGTVALVPGGIGIYEALMVAVLTSAGIPLIISFSVTLVYRVINMAIFLPVGFYYYTKHLKKQDQDA